MKLTNKEKEELDELERQMAPLRKAGMSKELVELGIRRSRILNKIYGDSQTYSS